MAAVALRPIHKIRLRNLSELIEKRFDGNASEAARAIERSHTFMWQLLNKYRSIGEETARHIEQVLSLGENALDHKLQRTKALVAHAGDGTTAQYPMVPVLSLDALESKPKLFRPCPDASCTGKCFAAEITSDEMVELQIGDTIFAEAAAGDLQARKLYVVTQKRAKVARVMQAKRVGARWVFMISNSELREKPIDAADVHVNARVILVVRNLR